MENTPNRIDDSVAGKTCVAPGAGDTTTHTAEKLIELDAEAGGTVRQRSVPQGADSSVPQGGDAMLDHAVI